MSTSNLIEALVYILPTALFVLIILLSFLLGFFRGFRKSLILLINAFIALSISLILFFALSTSTTVDKYLLSTANSIMGSSYYIQNKLGVSTSCDTLREVILEYIPKNVNFFDGLSLILEENGAYLATLVDMVYRIIFGILCYILYYIFIFIGYIIYLIFFKEGRYKKKMEKGLLYGENPHGYQKKKLKGGFLNLTRGIVKACVDLSFIGMIFYIVAGGIGDRTKTEFDTTNEDYNLVVDAYDAIGSYGTKGIYKVLNMCKDKNDVPYYLFAADLVFKGNLYDSSNSAISNVYLKDEIAVYTKFSRDTADLLLKYGDKEIRDAILNKNGNVWDVLYPIFLNENFQSEFREVINNFEGGTYFVNLTYSLIVSVSSHLDKLSFTSGLPDIAVDLLSILFNENYHSPDILYEASLASTVKMSVISPEVILNKDDIGVIYDLFVLFLNTYDLNSEDFDYKSTTITYIKNGISTLKNLSIFNSSNSDELDPTYKRLMAYFTVYLNNMYEFETTLEDTAIYYTGEFSGVSWSKELEEILDIVVDATYIYEDISDKEFSETSVIVDNIYTIVSNNKTRINNIVDYLVKSDVISASLKTKVPEYYINMAFESLDITFKMPEDITFVDTYVDGTLKEGELSIILNTILTLCDNQTYKEYIVNIIDSEEILDKFEYIGDLVSDIKNTSINSKPALDYLSDSKFINTILTNIIYSLEIENITIYQDSEVLLEDANGAKFIEDSEYKLLINNIFDFLDLVTPLIDDPSTKNIVALLENEKIEDFLDSKIIGGTLLDTALNKLNEAEGIITPKECDTDEIRRLINIIHDDTLDIDLESLIDGNTDSVTNMLDTISKESFDTLYASKILAINITHNVKEAIKDYEYETVLENENIYDKDTETEGIYKSNEVYALINSFKILDIKITDIINDPTNSINTIKDNLWNLNLDNMSSLWESNLLSGMVSKQLDDTLTSDTLELNNIGDVMHDPIIFETTNDLYHYKYSEIYNLKEALKYSLNITSLNNVEVSIDSFFNLYTKDEETGAIDSSKVSALYNSSLAIYIVSDKLDTILKNDNVGLVDSEIKTIKKNDTLHTYDIYQENEMTSLLSCLKYDFKIDSEESLNNINYNSLISGFNDNNIDNIYSSSICKLILTKNLDKILTSDYIDYDVRENKTYIKEESNSMTIYRAEEIKNLLKANEVFSFFDSEGNFNIPDQTTLNKEENKNKRDVLYDSYIILGVITKYVKSDITKESEDFVDTPLAYFSNEFKVYKRNELNDLINLIDGDSEDAFNNLSISSSIDGVNDSYLLWASVSKNFIDTSGENLVIVDDIIISNVSDGDIIDTTNKFIERSEIIKVLESSKLMGISNISDMENFDSKSNISKDNLDTILDGIIMRTTLPTYLKIEKDKQYYILSQILSNLTEGEKYSLSGSSIYVLNKTDFVNTLTGLLDMTDNSGGLFYELPDDLSKLFIYDSYNDVPKPLLIMISTYLSRKVTIGGASSYFENIDCYNLYTYEISSKLILTKEGYEAFYKMYNK